MDLTSGLRVQEGGRGEPALLLLHGLGATCDVWAAWTSVLSEQWPGRWVAPDLPGHGRSRPLPRYTYDEFAASVAELVATDDEVVVLGHSMGGVVGLVLADGSFGVAVRLAVGLGVKVAWTGDELAKARAMAERPVTWFPSRDEAAARYLRVSGLGGLLAANDPAVGAGLREADGQWRLAQDPATFGVGAPDMLQVLQAAQCPVTLARGEHDPLVSDEQLAALDPGWVRLDGLGHNAHVEDPAAVMYTLLLGHGRES